MNWKLQQFNLLAFTHYNQRSILLTYTRIALKNCKVDAVLNGEEGDESSQLA